MPGSASSCSAVAELMSSNSAFGAGAIFSAGAIFAPGAILPPAAGWVVWAIDGAAASRPMLSAAAAREANVNLRMVSSRDGLGSDKASCEFVAAPWPPREPRINPRNYLRASFRGAPVRREPGIHNHERRLWIPGPREDA